MPRKKYDLLAEHPEMAKWTYDDLQAEICRLEAQIEDRENRRSLLYRQHGCLSPDDSQLFLSIWSAYSETATLAQVMEALRLKRRRGHKQQAALEIWDAHYSHGGHFGNDREIDYLESLFDKQEAARDAKCSHADTAS